MTKVKFQTDPLPKKVVFLFLMCKLKKMKINFKLPLLSIGFILVLFGCGSHYNTHFPPPDPQQDVTAVFPEKIGDYARSLSRMANLSLPFIGVEATYGQGEVVINVIQGTTGPEADNFFAQKVAPLFDGMPSHFRGQVNGQWTASGTDKNKRVWYAWVNQNWVFVINALSQKDFDKVLGTFKYISK